MKITRTCDYTVEADDVLIKRIEGNINNYMFNNHNISYDIKSMLIVNIEKQLESIEELIKTRKTFLFHKIDMISNDPIYYENPIIRLNNMIRLLSELINEFNMVIDFYINFNPNGIIDRSKHIKIGLDRLDELKTIFYSKLLTKKFRKSKRYTNTYVGMYHLQKHRLRY